MKVFLKVILCVLIAFILIAGGAMFYLSRGLDSGSKLVINGVDLSLVEDGTYVGKYQGGRWTNEVSVEVQNHQITQVVLVKDVAFAKPEVTSELFSKVVQGQSVTVDAIAGATVTSKAYLKAIENALSGNSNHD